MKFVGETDRQYPTNEDVLKKGFNSIYYCINAIFIISKSLTKSSALSSAPTSAQRALFEL